MKIAYADPPYIGQAKKHYAHDPRGEVDHRELILQLQEYDGWALSASSPSLQTILSMCPWVRIAAWVKPFCSWKPGVNPAYAWEPVIFVPSRQPIGDNTVRDWHSENITLKRGLSGVKPQGFCFWVFQLIGARPEDDFFDLFPGSGAVSKAWEQWCETQNGCIKFEQISLCS